jgi:predicted DsbA family dithiol-disulfide isomerase
MGGIMKQKEKEVDPPEIRIDAWSDYVCPYCYLEVPILDRLQGEFKSALQIHWRAFELRPDPIPTLDPAGEYLRTTWDDAVYPMAERRGMNLRLPPMQPRSRKALEAAAYARREGKFGPMHRALFHAFFEEGRDIGEIKVLLEIAESAGLKREPLYRALEEGRETEEVLRDQELARNLRISAVPTMVLRRTDAPWQEALAISGAQPYEAVLTAVKAMQKGEVFGE